MVSLVQARGVGRVTGTSIRDTSFRVFRSPMVTLEPSNRKNSRIMQATEAGKETWPIDTSALTPKHASRTVKMPAGT